MYLKRQTKLLLIFQLCIGASTQCLFFEQPESLSICGWIPFWGIDQTLAASSEHLDCFDDSTISL